MEYEIRAGKSCKDDPVHLFISLEFRGQQGLVELESDRGGDTAKMKCMVSSKQILRGILQIYKHILTN